MERKIIHIDMDAFFASVEQRDNPQLQGLPIAIGNDEPRGVVSTASYEARKFGVHSAQSIVVAKKRCPQLVIVEPHFDKYQAVNAEISRIFHDYTDLVEFLSIDEAFLDVTDNKKGIPLAVDIAREIKQRIHTELHLTASAGVSYCKFLAKVASDYRKPDGLCTIHPSQAQTFIDHLRVEQFWGVGPKTATRMHHAGIYTGEQLRQYSRYGLKSMFGKMGEVFYQFARGIDDRAVVPLHATKSIGCEHTFEKDISSDVAVIVEIYRLVLELRERLKKHRTFSGHTLTLKVKYSDFTQVTRSLTLSKPFKRKDQILPAAKQLAKKVDRTKAIRLLGLSVSNPQAEQKAAEAAPKWVQLEFDFK